jgi:site-specific recombinase XerD
MPTSATHPLVRSFLRGMRWAPTTEISAVSVLNRWHRWLTERGVELVEASRDDCEMYLAEREAAGIAAATRQVDWRMLRALHHWLADEGEADRNPMARVKAPTVSETPVKVLDEREYRALVASCDRRTTGGRRDEAILSLLWWSGLRRSEVCALDLEALDLRAGTVTIGSRAFTTKTNKVRRVPLAGETVAAFDRYLRRRGDEPGPLFLSERGDTHDERRLRPNSIQLMIRRRATQARLGRPVGAHEFRRAMAVRHKRRGGSDPALMAIAGWSSIRMVDRYTRMEREELAAEEFHRLIDDSAPAARRRGRRVS